MKGLFLPGYACNKLIWKQIENDIKNKFKGIVVEWPKNKTKGFDKLDDYSNWVKVNYVNENNIEYIVGHSMGGLVALKLAKKRKKLKNVILIESFIKTPSKFFHNVVYNSTPEPVKKEILNMLVKESNFYSDKLKKKIRELDYSNYVKEIDTEINLIYGDRGNKEERKVIEELKLKKEILTRVNIKTVSNSSHFPMVENPEETVDLFKKILN